MSVLGLGVTLVHGSGPWGSSVIMNWVPGGALNIGSVHICGLPKGTLGHVSDTYKSRIVITGKIVRGGLSHLAAAGS